jgi:transposase
MRVVFERCAGLDVHKKTVVACLLTPEGKEVRTFGTMTQELLALADWLEAQGATHVAMESAGVFWKPVYNLLEELDLTVLLVNARHMKAVPGRKTDVKDAEWIADLLRHGLLKASFVPDRPQRELRELIRYRRSVIQQRSQVVNRLQKVLEGANIKLASVASNIVGASGLAMLQALTGGEDDPEVLADLAKGTLKAKRAELAQALQGVVGPHQRLLIASALRHLNFLDGDISRLDEEVNARLTPFADELARLATIPGVGRRTAEVVVAEIGLDMTRFPTAGHLASWARVCPGNHESGGKRKGGSAGQGNRWLRAALVEAAWAASHTKNNYLASQYHRLAARRGGKRAALAVAHSILVIIYHLLQRGTTYEDLGGNYFDERNKQVAIHRSVRRIEQLGYRVTLEAA